LLKYQWQAYDIINWHLMEMLSGQEPPQLLMHIPGEGGVGKSKTSIISMIQTITENFMNKGAGHLLVKGAYTGIAASIVDSKTLHMLAHIPVNCHEQSQKAIQKLAIFWKDKCYWIIDELSMVGRIFFAQLSTYL
ncbi:hypothetical protein PAXRUDRAFT_73888, partial [Paxillus rubicundulus Ve08.2h10]